MDAHTCKARRMQDQMQCAACGLAWDIDDPDPPECPLENRKQRGLAVFAKIKEDLKNAD